MILLKNILMGGHKNAAGGISKDSLKKTIELVNKHLESFLKNS